MNRRRLLLSLVPALSAAVPARADPPANFTAADVLGPQRQDAPREAWRPAAGRELVSLTRPDGAVLRGWSYRGGRPDSRLTLVIFGGTNHLVLRDDASFRALAACAARLVTYDYRGFGFSGGAADLLAFRHDAAAIVDDLAGRSRRYGDVALLGYSLGSMVASHVAAARPVGALVLLAGLSNPDLMARLYPDRLRGVVPAPDALDVLNVTRSVGRSRAPLLVLHGAADMVVNVAEGRANLAASPSPRKRMIEMPGVGHDDLLGRGEVRNALCDFLHGGA